MDGGTWESGFYITSGYSKNRQFDSCISWYDENKVVGTGSWNLCCSGQRLVLWTAKSSVWDNLMKATYLPIFTQIEKKIFFRHILWKTCF